MSEARRAAAAFLALVAAGACAGAASSDRSPPRAFGFRLDATFGAQEQPADAVLGFIHDIAVDASGTLYVLQRPPAITAFSPSGDVLWVRAHAGEGPGELQYASSLALDGSGLLVIGNHGSTQLDLWNAERGEFVRRVAASDFGMRLANAVDGLESGGVAIAESLFGRVAVRVLGIRFEQGGDTRLFDTTVMLADEEIPARFALDLEVASSPWSPVTVGNDRAFDLRVLSSDGVEALRLTRPEFDRLTGTLTLEQGGTGALISMGGISAPRRLRDGQWLVSGSWIVSREDVERVRRTWLESARMFDALARAQFENSWWVLDSDGALVGEAEVEEGRESHFGRLAGVDHEGRILTILQDPYPHVARWILEWDPQ